MKAIISVWNEHQGRILQFVLGGIFILFIIIMVGVYLIAKQANPIILDEKGRPMGGQTTEQRGN